MPLTLNDGTPLGWAIPKNSRRDEVGVLHLLVAQPEQRAGAACGARPFSFGGVEYPPYYPRRDMRANRCETCAQALARMQLP